MMPSRRLRNSGENTFLSISMPSVDWSCSVKPMVRLLSTSAPALVVMITITLRKSALRPLLSVRLALSITCNRMLNTSGCAFSISSSSSTQCGVLVTASVSRPPWSKPT